MTKIGNQQLRTFTREQLQVFLTAHLGDGCIHTSNSNSTYYITNCIHEEYIDFKKTLLGNMFKKKKLIPENGYANTPIWGMRSKSSKDLNILKEMDISEVVNHLDELGIALWFYDDGSLHRVKGFYNLNTHKFPKEIQEEVFIPFFHKFGIYPTLRTERKKDGRLFYYLSINKYNGADKISEILSKYPIDCYSCKVWSSETIQKWSKLQEELKSANIDIKTLSSKKLGALWSKISI